jgi:hypothetical protein
LKGVRNKLVPVKRERLVEALKMRVLKKAMMEKVRV